VPDSGVPTVVSRLFFFRSLLTALLFFLVGEVEPGQKRTARVDVCRALTPDFGLSLVLLFLVEHFVHCLFFFFPAASRNFPFAGSNFHFPFWLPTHKTPPPASAFALRFHAARDCLVSVRGVSSLPIRSGVPTTRVCEIFPFFPGACTEPRLLSFFTLSLFFVLRDHFPPSGVSFLHHLPAR